MFGSFRNGRGTHLGDQRLADTDGTEDLPGAVTLAFHDPEPIAAILLDGLAACLRDHRSCVCASHECPVTSYL